MIEDDRSILAADIGSLPVQLGWVVKVPKNVQQLLVADQERIILDEHNFGVTGAIAANVLVGGTFRFAAAVTHGGGEDPFQLPKSGLDTPKTSCSESCFFHITNCTCPEKWCHEKRNFS